MSSSAIECQPLEEEFLINLTLEETFEQSGRGSETDAISTLGPDSNRSLEAAD
jgi:hypothetical protein